MSEHATAQRAAEPQVETDRLLIGGRWVASAGSGGLAVVNPVTESVIATVPRGNAQDVDRAVHAARKAFPAWSRTSVQERSAMLMSLAAAVESQADVLTELVVHELGYPVAAARRSQVDGAVEELELMAELVTQIAWREDVAGAVVRREPAGVVGAITAWNAPLRSVISKAAAAMAAGCTVVLKPSEVAPLTAYAFARMVVDAGVPDGVFNLLSGTGPEVGAAIAAHPDVDLVSLTGSVGAGRAVMRAAAENITRVHLELGGKSANVLLADADMELALTDGVSDALRNAGQVCGGLTRVLVPRDRLHDAGALTAELAEGFVLGDPFEARTTLGPVATAAQRDRVRAYIRGGMDAGLERLCGGPEAPDGLDRGFFVRPTVFLTDNHSTVAREEIFGPVLALIPYDSEDEAIDLANDSPYGLAGAVWSADPERAADVATRLRTGRVRINGAPLSKRAVHGGFKLSGIGREWGRIGIEEFLEYQSLMTV